MAERTPGAAPTEADLRELALRGESLRQQLAAVEAQRDYVAELLAEARRSLTTLEHMTGAQAGDEVLVPLGAGAFVHARLADPSRTLASLGSGLHAEVPSADARDRMRTRVQSLETAAATTQQEATRLLDEMTRINAVLETYYRGE